MNFITLDDGKKIYIGNFSFIYEATKNIELYCKFLEAEQVFKLNYIDFSHKLRLSYEAFALFAECKRRKNTSEYYNKEIEDIKSIILEEITTPASIINYKSIIIDLCSERTNEFKGMLLKYSFLRNSYTDNNDIKRALKRFIRYIYDFGSKSSHINSNLDKQFIPNKTNCLKVINSFHDFLVIYYGVHNKFDTTLIPIKDYIPIHKNICEDMGLNLDKGKYLFVRKTDIKNNFYIFSSKIDDITSYQKRDIETINNLWENNYSDPSNIIRISENISGSSPDYSFQVFSLPSQPMKLNDSLLKRLTIADKFDIIYGLSKGVLSMHEYDPPFYHRNICPDAFYIFDIKGKYKALLARFDCTKDNSINSNYTVINNVEKKADSKEYRIYYAPEVREAKIVTNINWEKVDIYSLAQTFSYIFTGKVFDAARERKECIEKNIADEVYILIQKMLSNTINVRPSAYEVVKKIEEIKQLLL